MPGVHFSVPAAVQDVSVWLLLQEVALQVKRVALDCHAIYTFRSETTSLLKVT